MDGHQGIRAARQGSSGFTLVELLVTISIIAILASLILFAMYSAQESARDTKTRSMITRLNAVIMPQYELYRSQRMPIDARKTAMDRGLIDATSTDKQIQAALGRVRLDALHEMMRMEMPDRWSDVIDGPTSGIARPAVSKSYLKEYNDVTAATGAPTTENQGAECLYMIVSRLGEDATEFFKSSDSGDTDEDGMPEFLDGWKRPIYFLRWPAGFTSQLQNRTDPDPLDARKVYPQAGQVQATFLVLPLVYSAGPDGITDIKADFATPLRYSVPASRNNNPFLDDASDGNLQIGAPKDLDSDDPNHFDNVHSHYIGRRA